MSKNKDIEKGDNDKDEQYQKGRYNLFIFQKTEKIEFWTYIAYVIVLIIYFQLVMVIYL